MSYVLITAGPGAGQNIAPSTAGVVVGRPANLEVTLDSAAVSQRHARLTNRLELVKRLGPT